MRINQKEIEEILKLFRQKFPKDNILERTQDFVSTLNSWQKNKYENIILESDDYFRERMLIEFTIDYVLKYISNKFETPRIYFD